MIPCKNNNFLHSSHWLARYYLLHFLNLIMRFGIFFICVKVTVPSRLRNRLEFDHIYSFFFITYQWFVFAFWIILRYKFFYDFACNNFYMISVSSIIDVSLQILKRHQNPNLFFPWMNSNLSMRYLLFNTKRSFRIHW